MQHNGRATLQRRGHHHRIDAGRHQLFEGVKGLGIRVIAGQLLAALGGPGHHADERSPGQTADQRRVKEPAALAVAY
ncbi:hypothetical protein D3C78_1578400 [compost metagenome]